jgi:hypothetical protein
MCDVDEQPTITCPNTVIVNNDVSMCGATVNNYFVVSYDSHPDSASTTCNPSEGTLFYVYDSPTSVTCTITDSAGQSGKLFRHTYDKITLLHKSSDVFVWCDSQRQ